jgi:[acyl-carrier-protein] S-malonyltransferase
VPLAAVFPGQGAQKVGMLSELAEHYPGIVDTYRLGSDALGFDLWEMVQTASSEELTDTKNTQPALLAASVSLWRVWQGLGARLPDYLVGHSLGEYSALVCGEVLDYEDAIRLVRKRGELMNAAVPLGEGSMAAIMGLEDDDVVRWCDQTDGEVAPANYNAPGQVVIAGESRAVDLAIEILKEKGAKRAVKLDVSGPFHSRLMLKAKEEFAEFVHHVEFNSPQIPIIQNVNAEVVVDPDQIKINLIEQLVSPVLWVTSMHKLLGLGVIDLIECGPGSVLRGLAKRVSRDFSLSGLDGLEDMRSAAGL